MKKSLLSGILASAMAITLLAGCSGNSAGDGNNGDTIKIGAIGPLSGAASTYGVSVKEGAQLLEKEVNDAGGINGKKLNLFLKMIKLIQTHQCKLSINLLMMKR